MICKATVSLKYANDGKLKALDYLTNECLHILNVFVDKLWNTTPGRFPNLKTDTWLSARLQQNLSKQAAEVVRSQRKCKRKTKPEVRRYSFNLDTRFVDLRLDENSFDLWVRLQSLGGKLILKLPSKKHEHLNKFLGGKWKIKSGARLRRTDKGYFIDLFFEKPKPPKRVNGRAIGFDCGYKKLLADSDGNVHDEGLEAIYEKIARKRQNSKTFYRALAERDNAVNRTINQVNLDGVSIAVVENLKNVKRGSKGKIRKKFNNKLQRWTYPRVLEKLSRVCEESGITLIKVNPAFTSQTCSRCGRTDRRSRQGESFNCVCCGTSIDADYNAAINVLRRGVSSLLAAKKSASICAQLR